MELPEAVEVTIQDPEYLFFNGKYYLYKFRQMKRFVNVGDPRVIISIQLRDERYWIMAKHNAPQRGVTSYFYCFLGRPGQTLLNAEWIAFPNIPGGPRIIQIAITPYALGDGPSESEPRRLDTLSPASPIIAPSTAPIYGPCEHLPFDLDQIASIPQSETSEVSVVAHTASEVRATIASLQDDLSERDMRVDALQHQLEEGRQAARHDQVKLMK